MRWTLLRGWARDARHWGDFPAQLAAAIPGAEVRALDLPGTGTRNSERSPAAIGAIVDRVREDIGTGPHRLLGLSLGAMACVDWAVRYPAEVEACVLVNTSVRPFSPFYERLRPSRYPAVASLLLEKDSLKRETGILSLTSAGADVAQTWAAYAVERPVTPGNALRQLWAAARFSAPAAAPRAPVLVLSSARDRLVNPHCSEALARRWNAPHAVHPTAGHDLPLDDGPWVAAQVARWSGGLA